MAHHLSIGKTLHQPSVQGVAVVWTTDFRKNDSQPIQDPFGADIEDGSISGIQVNYKAATCGKPAGVTTLRH
ncbi:hypothetical protein P5673_014286 [Acropora cervicornis]|uniref:Uncharacterized protein n=1 Tax=Acropora cervicornis TaxID=6130 RepID=A0AAD9QJQ6_ACRCE|nr:hypothetical protein P5673_014286 [Acropora cervicornis]